MEHETKYNFPTSTVVSHLNRHIHDKIIDSIDKIKSDTDNDVLNNLDDAEFETRKKQLSQHLKRLLMDSGTTLVEQIETSDILKKSDILCDKENINYSEKENSECDRILKDLEVKKELIVKMKRRIEELDSAKIRLDDIIEHVAGKRIPEDDKENQMEK